MRNRVVAKYGALAFHGSPKKMLRMRCSRISYGGYVDVIARARSSGGAKIATSV